MNFVFDILLMLNAKTLRLPQIGLGTRQGCWGARAAV